MSNGFGTINTRNINEIVASLAKQIKDIKTDFAKDYTVLNNKLEKCEEVLQDLKDYIETVEENIESEYQNIRTQIEKFDEEIAEIRSELSQVNYRKVGNETVAVGIAPLSAYSATSSTYPFSAKYAINDSDGRNIVDTYATKVELSSVSSTLSADYTQKIAESSSEGMSALSSVSGLLSNAIDNESNTRQSKDEELENAISNESTERREKDNELEERISEEEVTRASAISGLQNLLEQEVIDLTNVIEAETTRATSAEDALRNSLSQEIVDRANAITDLGNSLGELIAEEENRATSAENDIIEYINDFADITEENIQTLENTISSVSSDLSLIINDNYDTLLANIEEEKNRASNEEYLLSSAISAEIDRATEAEQILQESINNETSAREQAISALQETITNEIESKINELSGTVETGFEQLNNVDTELSGHIDYVSAGVTALGNDLHTNYYTNIEVDEKIANFGGFEVHESLEEITDPKINVIYLIGPIGTIGPDFYKEYICTDVIAKTYVLIGDTSLNLSGYYTKTQVDEIVYDTKTELDTKIEELSGIVDTNISVLSSTIDREFERTYEYINELSSTFDTNISTLSSVIDENFDTVYDYIDDLSADIPELNQETDYLKVSLDQNGETIYGGMIGNHSISTANAGKVLRINTEGTDLELIRITGGLSYNEVDSSEWTDDVRVEVELDNFNDCGVIPANVKNIDFLFDKPIDPAAMPNGIIHFELPEDTQLLDVNVYYKVNDNEYMECNYSYLNRKDYKYPIYFNPKHIYQITLNNHNAAFFDFSDNVYEKKNYIQPWYLDPNSKILHHFPDSEDPEQTIVTSGSPYDEAGFENKISQIDIAQKFGYYVENASAGFSNSIAKIDIKTIYRTVVNSGSAGFDNKITQINRLDKYQYYSKSNDTWSVANKLINVTITTEPIEGYTREG